MLRAIFTSIGNFWTVRLVGNRILIIGADGFIGRALARGLVGQGHNVVALTRRPVAALDAGIEYRMVSGINPEDYRQVLDGCGTIFHVASASTPGSSAGRPLFELKHNLVPTFALLEALQAQPECRLIYISSGGTLYGDVTRERPATEQDLVRAKSYYAAGKAAAEQFIRAWSSQFSGTACIIRPSNVYGPGQCERQGFAIIPKAFGKTLRNETLTIWGDGSAVRDYLYIMDLVDLCTSLIGAKLPEGTTLLNASSGEDVSLSEVLARIEAVTGVALKRTYEPARDIDVARISIDSSLARSICGWHAQTLLNDGLDRSWSWFKSTQR